MADDNFKSLLSPQSSWYDIAKGAFNKDKKFQDSIIDIMNQKINCIEKFCFGMKNKYEI